MVQRLRFQVPLQGVRVRSLIRELRSHMCAKLLQSCLTLQPHQLQPSRLLSPWNSPGQNTRVGLPCPSPGDLSDPEIKFSSLVAPASQADSLPLSHHMPCGKKKKKKKKKTQKNTHTESPGGDNVFWVIATCSPYLLSPPLKKCTT